MNAIVTRIAAAAALGLAVSQAAIAAPTTIAAQAYVGGTGENESVEYAGTPPQSVPLAPAIVGGSGENISVELPRPVIPAHTGYVAVVEGSGENQSVRYVPVAPRG